MPTALITGTSSGLGRGVAERLHALGWDVIGTVRQHAQQSELPWHTVVADVTDDDAVHALGTVVQERWGRLDALVNNAGTGWTGPFEELSAAELRQQLDVNLVGAMALVRATLPALREAKGVVVQVSSVSGQAADAMMGAYNASKFGLEGASEALAAEVAPFGVRVVIVEPGPFRTEISRGGKAALAKQHDGLYAAQWREVDEWLAWHGSESPDAGVCVDAIVGAVTRPDAPFRIAVGEGIADDIRRHALGIVEQMNASEEFLRTL